MKLWCLSSIKQVFLIVSIVSSLIILEKLSSSYIFMVILFQNFQISFFYRRSLYFSFIINVHNFTYICFTISVQLYTISNIVFLTLGNFKTSLFSFELITFFYPTVNIIYEIKKIDINNNTYKLIYKMKIKAYMQSKLL